MSTGFLKFFDTPFGHALSGVRVQKVQNVQKVQRGKVLRIDRPDGRRVLRFDGAFGPEGCCGCFAASFIKRGAAGAAGCVEGLCPHRGNDSL